VMLRCRSRSEGSADVHVRLLSEAGQGREWSVNSYVTTLRELLMSSRGRAALEAERIRAVKVELTARALDPFKMISFGCICLDCDCAHAHIGIIDVASPHQSHQAVALLCP